MYSDTKEKNVNIELNNDEHLTAGPLIKIVWKLIDVDNHKRLYFFVNNLLGSLVQVFLEIDVDGIFLSKNL